MTPLSTSVDVSPALDSVALLRAENARFSAGVSISSPLGGRATHPARPATHWPAPKNGGPRYASSHSSRAGTADIGELIPLYDAVLSKHEHQESSGRPRCFLVRLSWAWTCCLIPSSCQTSSARSLRKGLRRAKGCPGDFTQRVTAVCATCADALVVDVANIGGDALVRTQPSRSLPALRTTQRVWG